MRLRRYALCTSPALLIDNPSILNVAPLRIANVGLPIWIVALLAGSGLEEFEVDWPGASADASMTPVADVVIARRVALRALAPSLRRALAYDATLAALGASPRGSMCRPAKSRAPRARAAAASMTNSG